MMTTNIAVPENSHAFPEHGLPALEAHITTSECYRAKVLTLNPAFFERDCNALSPESLQPSKPRNQDTGSSLLGCLIEGSGIGQSVRHALLETVVVALPIFEFEGPCTLLQLACNHFFLTLGSGTSQILASRQALNPANPKPNKTL